MAVDMFIRIGSLKGESTDKTHAGEIDVLAWSWGMAQSGSIHAGGGAGKVSVQDISFSKHADSSSNVLIKSVCDGTRHPDAILTVRKGGEYAIEYVVVKLREVFITSLTMGSNGGEDRLTENVTLSFAEFEYDYTPQRADGTPDAKKIVGFNLQTNRITK